MALTYCRECGGEVSSEAVVCPHCGLENPSGPARTRTAEERAADDRELARSEAVVREPVVVQERKSGAGRTIALLLLLVLVALALAWYFGLLT